MRNYFSKIFGAPPRRTLIRDLRVGALQSIEGIAVAIGEPFPSPFSGTLCASLSVLHQYEVPLDAGGRDSHDWPVKEFISRRLFFLRDESGLVRVDRGAGTHLFNFHYPKTTENAHNRAANLAAFRTIFDPSSRAEEAMLAALDRVIRTEYLEGWEVIIPAGARVRVEGIVRSTGEPIAAGGPLGFREAPTLFELGSEALRMTRIERFTESSP